MDDTEGVVPVLPERVMVECDNKDDAENIICDYLSDTVGFCVKSFEFRKILPLKHYLIHFKQTVDGIDTEVSRYWRCDAEDYCHAIEQLNEEVIGSQGEQVTFHELIKISV